MGVSWLAELLSNRSVARFKAGQIQVRSCVCVRERESERELVSQVRLIEVEGVSECPCPSTRYPKSFTP